MIMHANTHSANFDENVASTSFTVSVIAYQWGWNYFFPRDVVEAVSLEASVVGHGCANDAAQDTHQVLTEHIHRDFVLRSSNRDADFSRSGLAAASGTLALLARPGTALGSSPLSSAQQYFSEVSGLEEDLDSRDSVAEPSAEAVVLAAGTLADDAGSLSSFQRLANLIRPAWIPELGWGSGLVFTDYPGQAPGGYSVSASALAGLASQSGLPVEPSSLRVWLADAARAKRSLVASGSRLTRVLEHASAQAGRGLWSRPPSPNPIRLTPTHLVGGPSQASSGELSPANVLVSSSGKPAPWVQAASDFEGGLTSDQPLEVEADDLELAYSPSMSSAVTSAAVLSAVASASARSVSGSPTLAPRTLADQASLGGEWSELWAMAVGPGQTLASSWAL